MVRHSRGASSCGTAWTNVLRKILGLDLSSAGKRADTYFQEERSRDVSEIEHIGIYRDTKKTGLKRHFTQGRS